MVMRPFPKPRRPTTEERLCGLKSKDLAKPLTMENNGVLWTDMNAIASAYSEGFVETPTNKIVSQNLYLKKQIQDLYEKKRSLEIEIERLQDKDLDLPALDGIMNNIQKEADKLLAMPTRKKKDDCEHPEINYITDGKGDLTVWCKDCGESQPSYRAEKQKQEIYKKASQEEPPHELEVIQRLSEAYRENEREIESEIKDEETRKTLGTVNK
jgi:hypothetical protein